MPFLLEKDRENPVPLAGVLATCRPQAGKIESWLSHGRPSPRNTGPPAVRRGSLDGERLAAAAGRSCVRVLDCESTAGDRVDEIDLGTLQIADANRGDVELNSL